MNRVEIYSPSIKLDAALKLAGHVPSGGEAKMRIISGDVLVNAQVCLARGKKLFPGDTIRIDEIEYTITNYETANT
ncbi:MAG: RNA-binding S4 domain-containing protein [Oscillospiraceae bacterium]|jgi:ribosome-associated protein|nr:RNA-binding S4 domain-containing protein [Oscillospiraceae bacterium]